MDNNIITFENVEIFYNKKQPILKDVNFSVCKNDFITIIGANGSGKTSIMKAMFRMAKYDGVIRLYGKNIKKYSSKDVAKKLTYITQIEESIEGIKVLEYLKMARMPYYNIFNSNAKDDVKLIDKYLEDFNLKHLANEYLDSLSGGQRQLISIICGIIQETDILLIDEPTNHLDPKVVLMVFDMLKKLHDSGKTIILISHSLNESLTLTNKLMLVDEGTIYAFGSVKNVLNKKNIDKIFNINSKIVGNQIKTMKLND